MSEKVALHAETEGHCKQRPCLCRRGNYGPSKSMAQLKFFEYFRFRSAYCLVVTSFTHNIPLSLQYIHDNFKKGRQYSKTGGVDKCEKVFLKLVAVLRDKFK